MVILAAYLVIGLIFVHISGVFVDALEVNDGLGTALNAAVLFAWPVAVPLGIIFSLFVWLATAASQLRDRVVTTVPAPIRAGVRRARPVLRSAKLALGVLWLGVIATTIIVTIVDSIMRHGAPL